MIAASPLKLSRSGVLTLEQSRALSAEAQTLWRYAAEVRYRFEELFSLQKTAAEALSQLDEAKSAAAVPNWDGYGARPIDEAAYALAKRFIRSLPTTTPTPEVGVDPDGEVSIDWHFGPRQVLSVSVGPSGRL